jgi:hypothetical protein
VKKFAKNAQNIKKVTGYVNKRAMWSGTKGAFSLAVTGHRMIAEIVFFV